MRKEIKLSIRPARGTISDNLQPLVEIKRHLSLQIESEELNKSTKRIKPQHLQQNSEYLAKATSKCRME